MDTLEASGAVVRRLVLVRHSLPEIVPGVPASRWRLSDEGRLRCEWLADQLVVYAPSVIVTSQEPKAIETGRIVADRLGKSVESAQGLHEHDRSGQVVGSRNEFEERVARLFENPGQLVFGRETADEAHRRFSRAVSNVIEAHPSGDVVIVSHGTVITLFVTRVARLEPFPFWKRFGLPSFVVLSVPGFELGRLVYHNRDA